MEKIPSGQRLVERGKAKKIGNIKYGAGLKPPLTK